jgi:hypothetical protein
MQVERILGHPMWSGTPEEAVFEADREKELWYEYQGADGSAGRTTVVMNRNRVVVAVLVYPKKALPLRRAIELYGSQYVEKKWNPCLTERERGQIKNKDKPPLETFLVYPEKGMILMAGEYGDIWEIVYLLRCP